MISNFDLNQFFEYLHVLLQEIAEWLRSLKQ